MLIIRLNLQKGLYMKTAVIMKRELMGIEVRQNHKTKMFNANDLHKIGNEHRKVIGLPPKQLAHYFGLDSTGELIKELCLTEVCRLADAKQSTKGKYGGTWVHPVIFVDLAMWYSPKLRVQIIKWALDSLMEARDESGDSFNRMNSTLARVFKDEFNGPISFIKAAKAIAAACGVGEGPDKWQRASEEQLKLRQSIQDNIELIADLCPNAGECISKSIAKALARKSSN
jgi:hypothetical protein